MYRPRGRLSSCTVMCTDKCDPSCQEHHHPPIKTIWKLTYICTYHFHLPSWYKERRALSGKGQSLSKCPRLINDLTIGIFVSLCLPTGGENTYALVFQSLRNRKKPSLDPTSPLEFLRKNCLHFLTFPLVLNPLWSGFFPTTPLSNCSCQIFVFILLEFSMLFNVADHFLFLEILSFHCYYTLDSLSTHCSPRFSWWVSHSVPKLWMLVLFKASFSFLSLVSPFLWP